MSESAIYISAAGSGIGFECAKHFLSKGARVFAVDKEPAGLAKLQENQSRDRLHIYLADFLKPGEAEKSAEACLVEFGPIQSCFNGVGLGFPARDFHSLPREQAQKLMQVNLFSLIEVLQVQIRSMLNLDGGSIVNCASAASHIGIPGQTLYSASKHAVLGLTKSLALEYGKQNIRVNCVSPGPIDTPFLKQVECNAQLVAQAHPMGRLGHAEDVVGAVEYLLSDAARYVTGHSLVIDGGWTSQ